MHYKLKYDSSCCDFYNFGNALDFFSVQSLMGIRPKNLAYQCFQWSRKLNIAKIPEVSLSILFLNIYSLHSVHY